MEVQVEAQVGGGALDDRDRACLAAGVMTAIPGVPHSLEAGQVPLEDLVERGLFGFAAGKGMALMGCSVCALTPLPNGFPVSYASPSTVLPRMPDPQNK